MEDYHSLKIFKYQNPTCDLTNEYKNRIESPATIVTKLKINSELNGEKLGRKYPLFFMPIKQVLKLQTNIEQNSRDIIKLTDSLPGLASKQFFNKTLIDEIMSTNEIEGVKTLNKEVIDAINSAETESNKKIRLKSFAKMYLKIKNSENLNIQNLEDIREIYDYLLEGEVPLNKLPDGNLFRNSYARIGTDTKTVHTPSSSEQEISLDLKDWITFINEDEISPIYKAFIAHYFFENIHPFNDGNGRTGRYIACVYLGYKLDPLSAITFSSEINKNKSKYYNAFKEVSEPNNFGEITFFVITMMKILIKGQKNILEEMQTNKNMLKSFQTLIEKDERNDNLCQYILYFYLQSFLFNDSGIGIEDRQMKILANDYHWTKVKRCLTKLSENGTIEITKMSPITRKLSNDYLKKLLQKEDRS